VNRESDYEIMKKIICLIFVGLAVCAFGQAQLGPHKWTIALKILDDDGKPVEGARTWVAYGDPKEGHSTDPFQSNDWAIAGLTDSNGMFAASHTDRTWNLGIQIQKAGYYSTRISYELYVPGQFDAQKVATNRNPKLTLTLKKIGVPIPMYAKSLNTHVPDLDKPVGYDLLAGDWVTPYGKGNNADINFIGHFDKRADGESDFTLTVNFPKVGDGIQEFTVPEAEKGSSLRSPHEAPTGGYQSQWVQTDNRKPGKPISTNRDPNQNYFFRVQTVLDAQGKVKSALYGKIYGDFMEFIFYLNPTPNDRSVEFDPKHNLMKNLNEFEGVNRP
jgi:hypothetical protein